MIGVAMNSIPPVIAPAATDGTLALLTLLADPAGTKKMLGDLIAARDEAVAATKSFGDAKAKSDELDQRAAALTRSETTLAESRRDLQRQRDELAAERAEHAAEVERHRRAIEQLAADRVDHEAAVKRHRDQVAALRGALGITSSNLFFGNHY
jgi:chromosome segregation ATPase